MSDPRQNCAHPDLLKEILEICERTRTAKTRFGIDAIGDANLIDSLQAGRELRRRTQARIRAYMEECAARGGAT